MQQATVAGYSLDVVQRAGQPAPLHIQGGLAFVYDRSLAWAALVDDVQVRMKPTSVGSLGDWIAPFLHQTNQATIEHFANAAKLLLDGAQAHTRNLPAELIGGLPNGSDKRLANAATAGVVLGELIDPSDRLAEVYVQRSDSGHNYVWLLVIRRGRVVAAVRMPRSIGIQFLGTIDRLEQ